MARIEIGTITWKHVPENLPRSAAIYDIRFRHTGSGSKAKEALLLSGVREVWCPADDDVCSIDIHDKSRHGLNVGDLVDYTNDQGVVFQDREILFFEHPENVRSNGADVNIVSDCWWVPKHHRNLTLSSLRLKS